METRTGSKGKGRMAATTPTTAAMAAWIEGTGDAAWMDDDPEAQLVLPDGPLHLHLHLQRRSLSRRSQHTLASSLDDAFDGDARSVASTSTSSSNALCFSDSETDPFDGLDCSLPTSKRPGSEGHFLKSVDVGNDDDEDDDHKSDTIKASQLPADFATLLAQSKALAHPTPSGTTIQPLTKSHNLNNISTPGIIRHLGSKTQTSPADDWEEDVQGLHKHLQPRLLRRLRETIAFPADIDEMFDDQVEPPTHQLISVSLLFQPCQRVP